MPQEWEQQALKKLYKHSSFHENGKKVIFTRHRLADSPTSGTMRHLKDILWSQTQLTHYCVDFVNLDTTQHLLDVASPLALEDTCGSVLTKAADL